MSETMAARTKLPLALAATVVVAEVAVLLLRPRTGVIAPADVPVEAYFSGAEVARAASFRSGQTALFVAGLAIEVAVLALAAFAAGRSGGRLHARLLGARRPVLSGAAVGAALALVTSVAAVPVGAIARERAIDVGLVTQGIGGWARDLAVGGAIAAVFAAAGGAIAVALLRRAPRRWWLAGAAAVVAFGALVTYAGPVVLDPLFNDFRRLEPGPLRSQVLDLSERAGVDVGEVYVADASRRTTAANAYVAGLGRTKRVVLYDTLVEGFPPDEVRLVVAHELAHVRYADVPHGLLWLALVAPFALLAAAEMTRALPGGRDPRTAVPALALSVAVLVPVVTAISNGLSRPVEARADSYALTLTGSPEPFIRFEQRIARRNVADPQPPALVTALLATHPSVLERIGTGVAFARGARAAR